MLEVGLSAFEVFWWGLPEENQCCSCYSGAERLSWMHLGFGAVLLSCERLH